MRVGWGLLLFTCTCFSSMHYVRAQVPVDTLDRKVRLGEVVVKPKKEKYSKKNNPAVDFVNRLRDRAPDNDPLRNEHYSFRRYGRITLAVCPFDTLDMAVKGGRWAFLKDYVALSPLTDTLMLPVSVKERSSTVFYDNGRRREIVDAVKRDGMDEFLDQAGTEMYLEDVMRDIDIFSNDITLFQNRFVSPVGRLAPDFYRFYLTDTIASPDGNENWIELSFTPMVNTTFGFAGRLYVAEGDTTMFVKKVRMALPGHINLNYVDRLEIDLSFDRAPDGSRLKTIDDFSAELKLLPSMPGIYARRLARYSEHSFDAPSPDQADILGTVEGEVITLAGAEAKGGDTQHWLSLREPATENAELRMPQLMARMHSVPLYHYGEIALRALSSGYVGTTARRGTSPFDLGPIYTFVSGNDLEGVRLKVGGMTMPSLSRRWFAGGYVAYGTRDRRLKADGWLEYSFIDKTRFVSEFPVRSLRLDYFDDVSYISRRLLYTEDDNMFMSLSRKPQHMMLYERRASMAFNYERRDHLSFSARCAISRKQHSPFIGFTDVKGRTTSHYWMGMLEANVRWAPGEKFYESPRQRVPINLDNFELTLTHRSGFTCAWHRTLPLNATELGIRRRFWLSAFGYVDLLAKAGHVWNAVPYPEIAMPSANLSYVIQTETFALVDPMEFVGDTYGQIDFYYRANGVLLNRIPLINKLRLREIIGLKGWWGHLSRRNRPNLDNNLFVFPDDAAVKSMPRPYLEASAGIENILNIFRVDYVWRLTYRREAPCLHGFRIAARLKF